MCGIVGYVGNKKALPVLIEGLKNLEYRGYDSAGIAYLNNNKINIIKEKGKIVNLENVVDFDIESSLGIGHTRWATHGEANKTNSHPHKVGSITLVHNGIIENYSELKKEMILNDYTFKSETDTEVGCAVIDYYYKKTNNIIETLSIVKKIFIGSYAMGIIVDNDNKLYAIKNKSPLIIGVGDQENYIASDVPAILKYTNKYILLDDLEYACINKDLINIYDKNNNIKKIEILTFSGSAEVITKNNYEHFMLKEMNEQPDVFLNTFNNEIDVDFSKYNKIDIVACGSAYHAGMVGKVLIEEYANIPVNVEIASEYRYKKLFLNKKTLVIVITQSGETADTLAALELANNYCDTLAIVNVVGSSIARSAKKVIYTKAGIEIAVATTKGYLAQVALLSKIALNIGVKNNKISKLEYKKILKDIEQIPSLIKELLNRDYTTLASSIYKSNDVYFLGRLIDYATCLEGSLKLKEISYIHSEAYAAGELKHGTISLIEKNTSIISVITNELIAEKTVSNLKEVKARGAKILVITTDDLTHAVDCADNIICIPKVCDLLQPILTTIPLQCISYEVAKLKGCDIDKPKNLAKSVTVE